MPRRAGLPAAKRDSDLLFRNLWVTVLVRDRPAAAHGRVIASSFRPHPLLRNSHAQTLFPTLLRSLPRLGLRRERLELDDGDFLELGWSGGRDGPLAILLHGLGGDFEAKYIRGTAQQLHTRGWRTVALQMRGAGPEPNRLPRCYNQGDTTDLLYLCRLLREREPATPLFAVGWSMGANILLKALGEAGDDIPLAGAVAASAPFQIQPCAERLKRGFSRIYQHHLLATLKQGLRRKHGPVRLLPAADLAGALKAGDFFAYDDCYTAPMNGYLDARDYYRRASCGQYLGGIRRPTLIVHALDDPFMAPSIVPPAQQLAPAVTLELSPRGGHVGFVAAADDGRPLYWLDRHIAGQLAGMLARLPD